MAHYYLIFIIKSLYLERWSSYQKGTQVPLSYPSQLTELISPCQQLWQNFNTTLRAILPIKIPKAPGHQYPQYWEWIFIVLEISFIKTYCCYRKQYQRIKLMLKKKIPSCLRVKSCVLGWDCFQKSLAHEFLWSSKSFTLPQPANHFFIKLNLLRVINTEISHACCSLCW